MRKFYFIFLLLLIASGAAAQRQNLQAGFDTVEYREMLRIAMQTNDTDTDRWKAPQPQYFKVQYSSPEMCLHNRWDLWVNPENTIGVISTRGTVMIMGSWLENVYAAMLPATGELTFSDSLIFKYRLSDNPRAAVHAGWLIGMAHLSADMVPKIKELYAKGVKQFIISGHSQGGAISYLLRSHFAMLQEDSVLPKDIVFKSYLTAAPKPGNLYYAYDYEYLTANGWAFNVVNILDWVPESPMSMQTMDDFNKCSPFMRAKALIKKADFKMRVVGNYMYRHLTRPTYMAQERFENILGKMAYKYVLASVPGYKEPEYFKSVNYMRAGATIVLKPDDEYYRLFPDSSEDLGINHYTNAYYYLSGKMR